MIQDVKLICMPSVSVRSCLAFVSKISSKTCFCKNKIIKKSNNVGVERGVATRSAQIVWPMMTVTGYCDKF